MTDYIFLYIGIGLLMGSMMFSFYPNAIISGLVGLAFCMISLILDILSPSNRHIIDKRRTTSDSCRNLGGKDGK